MASSDEKITKKKRFKDESYKIYTELRKIVANDVTGDGDPIAAVFAVEVLAAQLANAVMTILGEEAYQNIVSSAAAMAEAISMAGQDLFDSTNISEDYKFDTFKKDNDDDDEDDNDIFH